MTFVILDKRNTIIGVFVLAVVFSLGVIIGHFGRDSSPSENGIKAEALMTKLTTDQFSSEENLIRGLLNDVDPASIRSFLKQLTKDPHIAGQKRDNELIQYIHDTWRNFGLDHVELAEYDFYLSWPNQVRLILIN